MKVGQEMLTSFDEVFTLFPDPSRNERHFFVTDRVNPHGVPAKDRSNMLNPYEKANLYKVTQYIIGHPKPKEEAIDGDIKEVKSFISDVIDELRN